MEGTETIFFSLVMNKESYVIIDILLYRKLRDKLIVITN